MVRTVIAFLMVAALAATAWQQSSAQNPAPASNAMDAAKANLAAFAEALNGKNLDALAAFWTEDAEHLSDDGTATTGRANISALFKALFENHPKCSMKLTPASARMLGSEVLLIDGVSELKLDDVSESSRFESIWVKSGNGWKISRVRELGTLAAGDSNYEQLKQLEWMIGDWTSETGTYTVNLSIKWGKNKNWIIVDQAIRSGDRESVSVHKIIGWDPNAGQMRAWVFDSEAGFGTGLITRDGNSWIEANEAVNRTGLESTSIQTIQFVSDDNFQWAATDRELDSRPLPDIRIEYTRKKAAK